MLLSEISNLLPPSKWPCAFVFIETSGFTSFAIMQPLYGKKTIYYMHTYIAVYVCTHTLQLEIGVCSRFKRNYYTMGGSIHFSAASVIQGQLINLVGH